MQPGLFVQLFHSHKVTGYITCTATILGKERPFTPWKRLIIVFILIEKIDILTDVMEEILLEYFYSKTNQLHNISNLFYFGTTLYIFRTVFQSIIRSLRLCIQHQVYVRQLLWLLAYTWCCMYSLRLLMMDWKTVRNTLSIVPKYHKFEILCIWLVLL